MDGTRVGLDGMFDREGSLADEEGGPEGLEKKLGEEVGPGAA